VSSTKTSPGDRKDATLKGLSRKDLLEFFLSEIQGQPELEWHASEAFPDAWGSAIKRQIQKQFFIQVKTPAAIRHHTTVDSGTLAKQLVLAVASFAQTILLMPLEARVSRLENEFETLVRDLPRLPHRSTASERHESALELMRRIANHGADIQTSFMNAFGGVVPTITMYPTKEETDYSVVVVLDASKADPSVASKARAEGARRAFYEAVMNLVPLPLFDTIDFEFVFPQT
jgi:hypothetical protein